MIEGGAESQRALLWGARIRDVGRGPYAVNGSPEGDFRGCSLGMQVDSGRGRGKWTGWGGGGEADRARVLPRVAVLAGTDPAQAGTPWMLLDSRHSPPALGRLIEASGA